jgi:hypothetical protein
MRVEFELSQATAEGTASSGRQNWDMSRFARDNLSGRRCRRPAAGGASRILVLTSFELTRFLTNRRRRFCPRQQETTYRRVDAFAKEIVDDGMFALVAVVVAWNDSGTPAETEAANNLWNLTTRQAAKLEGKRARYWVAKDGKLTHPPRLTWILSARIQLWRQRTRIFPSN